MRDLAHTIFLHGFASSPGANKAVAFARAFNARGLELEVPDLNEGDFRGLTISRQLRLLERLVNPLPGPVLLVGSSLGAYLAALYSARSTKIAAQVLMAPAFGFFQRWSSQLTLAELHRWRTDGAIPTMHHASGREELIGWSLLEDAEGHDAFPVSEVPTLILQGSADEICPPDGAREYQKRCPQVELVMFEADHGLNTVVPELLRQTFNFLDPWLS